MKLDTHGAEAAILAGAQVTLARSSAWIVETYNQQITPDCLLFWGLCSYMVTRGFRPIDLIDVLHRPFDGTLWQMDLFFSPFGLGRISPPQLHVRTTDQSTFSSQWGEDKPLR